MGAVRRVAADVTTPILVLKGRSRYGALRTFADALHEGFLSLGSESSVLDLASPGLAASHVLEVIAERRIGAVVSFNGVGNIRVGAGQSAYEALGVSYLCIYVDHPLRHRRRLEASPQGSIATFIDRSHVEFVEKYLPAGLFSRVAFLPHGGLVSTTPAAHNATDRLLFVGTAPPALSAGAVEGSVAPELGPLVGETLSLMSGRNPLAFHRALEKALSSRGIPWSRRAALDLSERCFPHVARSRGNNNRLGLIEAVRSRGFSIDIYGPPDWERYCTSRPGLFYRGEIELDASLNLMRSYAAILNDNNDFPDGSHERVFNALLNGAVPITPRNPYYESFEYRDLCFPYERASFRGLPSSMQEVALVRSRHVDAALAQGAPHLRGATWASRAEAVLRLIAASRA